MVKGQCSKGDTCKFAHGAAELQRDPPPPPVVPPQPPPPVPIVPPPPQEVYVEEEEPSIPGLEAGGYDEAMSPGRYIFEDPMPYEVAYRNDVEKELLEEPKKEDVWRQVDIAPGETYWYNETTGVSQWENPFPEPMEATNNAAAAPDDYDALVKANEDGPPICEALGDGVLLRVVVKPGQDEDDVLDVTMSIAKISLRAPIEDRWCNQSLLAFCRRALHVPQRERNNVKIYSGDDSLEKVVFVPALTLKDVVKRLHKRMNFEVDTTDVDKWMRHTEKKQKEEERRMKRRKWA